MTARPGRRPGQPQTLAQALREQAADTPQAVLLVCGDRDYSYQEVLAQATSVASGLRALGLVAGDRVAIMAGNSAPALFAWIGVSLAGGVDVPVNVGARGDSLEYILQDAAPRFLVVDRSLLARWELLAGSAGQVVEQVVVLGTDAPAADAPAADAPVADVPGQPPLPAGWTGVSFEELVGGPSTEPAAPTAGEHATIMYTSGTTGPPKGVMLPHGYYPWYGTECGALLQMSAQDRLYCAQPLFHIDGRIAFMVAVMAGGSLVLRERFSASRFWADVEATGSTRYFYVGSMLWMLFKQPPRSGEGGRPTIGIGSAAPVEIHRELEQRFGTRLIDGFGMTEAILVSAVPVDQRRPGTMGRPLAWTGARLVDEDGVEVAAGAVGEIVLRPTMRHVFPLGYWRRPAETVEAWRDLWFHTGDLARADPQGYWTYVGRRKDSIRRRGENVSAWEVEQRFLKQEPVLEVAAFGVRSELGEEDIAILVVLRPGAVVSPVDLCAAVAQDLPYFMVPRYVEFVPGLPKTPSHRVEKAVVRARGLSDQAWDAVAHGWDPRSVVRS